MSKPVYRKPVVLVIRDGWGINPSSAEDATNALKQAKLPFSDQLSKQWPSTSIKACGLDVGLPQGVMGNSEVGHQNIGAGRIVDQELVRIDKGFQTGSIADCGVLRTIFTRTTKGGGKLHLMGLVSEAGVHSMLEHLYGLLRLAKKAGVKEAYVHAFMDGRDSPPTSGMGFIEQAEKNFAEIGLGKIATVSGRFWAMDRDERWDRVQKAYDCLTGRRVERTASSAKEAVQYYYDHPLDASRVGDEFIVPTQILGKDGNPVAQIGNGDAVIFFNFRGDRPREITRAFIDDDFKGFSRGPKLDLFFATMTNYQAGLTPNVLFDKPEPMVNILGAYLAEQGISQFRTAETEKFAHVTFFFNDYREQPFDLETRKLIPSPKEVATYDQKPEMSAPGVADAAAEAILSGKYGVVIVNFANPDMVGHTGNIEAAVKAVEAVDKGVEKVLNAVEKMGGAALITADHGNAEQMWDTQSNGPHTRHTLNPVEVVIFGKDMQTLKLRSDGRLADIAPTLLEMIGLPKPKEMTGESLILGGVPTLK